MPQGFREMPPSTWDSVDKCTQSSRELNVSLLKQTDEGKVVETV